MTPRPDWKMSPQPTPTAVATYYLDGSECYLHWTDPETREPATQGSESEIEWPFGPDDFATRANLEALGLIDAEM